MIKVRVWLRMVKSKVNSLKRLKLLLHQKSVSLESQQKLDAAIIVIMEEEDQKPLDKEAKIGDCVSPRKESATPCGGDELNVVEDVQDSTKG